MRSRFSALSRKERLHCFHTTIWMLLWQVASFTLWHLRSVLNMILRCQIIFRGRPNFQFYNDQLRCAGFSIFIPISCVSLVPLVSVAVNIRNSPQCPHVSEVAYVKSITERWRYFVDFLHGFESFYFPKRFIYLRGIAFSGPYRWHFRKARDFVYFIDPLLCIVASRAAFSRHGLLPSR